MSTLIEGIAALHESPVKICLVCTGAGAGCQNLLAQVPGASATLLECLLLYGKEALEDFVGQELKQFASEDTALRMAARAWRRAIELVVRQGGNPQNAVGVSVTGVIASNRLIRGDHRVFIAIRSAKGFAVSHIKFEKREDSSSVLGRVREGELCDQLAVNMILHAAGIPQVALQGDSVLGEDLRREGDKITLCPRDVPYAKEAFVPDSVLHVLYDGSFNPWHFGHEQIGREVKQFSGKTVVHAITDSHPDKGSVAETEMQARLAQFQFVAPVITTSNLRLYIDKARAYPGFAFIVGADTLARILDPKYGTPPEEVLRIFKECGTHFYVANRHDKGVMASLDLLRGSIPAQYQEMFTQLTTMVQISSSDVRAKKADS